MYYNSRGCKLIFVKLVEKKSEMFLLIYNSVINACLFVSTFFLKYFFKDHYLSLATPSPNTCWNPHLCINLFILTKHICFNHIYLTYSAFLKWTYLCIRKPNNSTLFWENNLHFIQVSLFRCYSWQGFYLLNDISANLERKISILQILSLPSFKKTWLYHIRKTVSDFLSNFLTL